jgi:TPP-dependent pyruvate/acetoin dehydrogenase alpha subunit
MTPVTQVPATDVPASDPTSEMATTPRASVGTIPEKRQRELFREMLLMRRFEEKVEERFRAGDLPGFLHVAIGQEAVASGVCEALEPDDVIASTHRAHAHTIAKGTPVNAIMAEMYGKKEGCSHGYGGSMHLYDVARGNMGANAVVGGGLPQIAGAALAFKLRGESRVAVAFFGDGATNTGAFHESMNLAQLWKLPVLFVLENNGWAESTPAAQQLPLAVEDMSQRAAAYGMTAMEVDGQDVEAVVEATRNARDHAVSGNGPVFMNVRTNRFTGHYVGDPQVYREKSEVRQLRETQDPLDLLRARLGMTGEEFDQLDAEVMLEVEGSVEFARAGTDPDPEDALRWVYADGTMERDA